MRSDLWQGRYVQRTTVEAGLSGYTTRTWTTVANLGYHLPFVPEKHKLHFVVIVDPSICPSSEIIPYIPDGQLYDYGTRSGDRVASAVRVPAGKEPTTMRHRRTMSSRWIRTRS